MIQGGCPLGNGTGGPGWKIKGEFRLQRRQQPIRHVRGVISMARAAIPTAPAASSSSCTRMPPPGRPSTPPSAMWCPAWMWWTRSHRSAPTGTTSPQPPSASRAPSSSRTEKPRPAPFPLEGSGGFLFAGSRRRNEYNRIVFIYYCIKIQIASKRRPKREKVCRFSALTLEPGRI